VLDLEFIPFISKEEIHQRCVELGKIIKQDYRDLDPMFLIVLNGAFIFAADIIRLIDIPCTIECIKIKSYIGTQSSGIVKIEDSLPLLEGKHILIIEDIIDSGLTMESFLEVLRKSSPKSIKIISLLSKPEALKTPIHIDYLGFSIPNKFVVGYGLDYAGEGRQLPDIWQLFDENSWN
jgi:hypoxanthine phosphoribosyltransferase